MALRYDIEEMVEDAFVSYLDKATSQLVNLKVLPAFDTDKVPYPCAMVKGNKATKISTEGAWSTSRKVMVDIAVIVEAAKLIDERAVVISGARDQNRAMFNAVMTALAIEDTDTGPADFDTQIQCNAVDKPKGLAAYLTYQKIPGIWIKFAQVQDVDRSVESDKRCLVSLISLAVIAQPVQIGGY